MKLIVGLGNPGKEYEMTRHNSGFCVLDAIAEECRVDITQKKDVYKRQAAGSTGHGLYGYGWPDCQLCKSFLWSGACHIGVKIQCADAAV